jgi:hypothetical protein
MICGSRSPVCVILKTFAATRLARAFGGRNDQRMLTVKQLRLRFASADQNASMREAPLSATPAGDTDDNTLSISLSVAIGVIVTFLLAMLRRGRPKETPRLDYTY